MSIIEHQKNVLALSRCIFISIITQQVLNSSLLTFYQWFMKKSLLKYVIPSTLTI